MNESYTWTVVPQQSTVHTQALVSDMDECPALPFRDTLVCSSYERSPKRVSSLCLLSDTDEN